jgi:hypothetical protein
MPLTSPQLARDDRLEAAARNSPPLRKGASGPAVAKLQQALIDAGYQMPITTARGSRPPDGIYGDETVRVVQSFQAAAGLMADGVAGTQTLQALDNRLSRPPAPPDDSHCCCGNPTLIGLLNIPALSGGPSKLDLDRGSKLALGGVSQVNAKGILDVNAKGILDGVLDSAKDILKQVSKASPPTTLKRLDHWLASDGSKFKTAVDATYKLSLDPTTIFVSDALGLDGRAFTAFIPNPAPIPVRKLRGIIVLNVGKATTVTQETVIHELAHAWQSQHASDQAKYMLNSIKSQSGASSAGPNFSAYAFQDSPRKGFDEYAAEQIAQQVERGIAPIITHMQGVAAWAIDGDNDTSLATPRWEDSTRAGVRI